MVTTKFLLSTTDKHRRMANRIMYKRGYSTEAQVWNRLLWEEAERLGLIETDDLEFGDDAEQPE